MQDLLVVIGQTNNFYAKGKRLQETYTYRNSGLQITIEINLAHENHNSQFVDLCVQLKIIVPGCVAAYMKNKKEGK